MRVLLSLALFVTLSFPYQAQDRGAVCTLDLRVNSAGLVWFTTAPMHDVLRGDLVVLMRSGGDFSQATEECLADDLPDTSLSYALRPGPGEGFWFLVRAADGDGSDSYDTCSASQVEGRDAEIAASTVDCP